ncbi:MAG TPA: hypothetical protein DCR97_00560 [Deltaproteobacteria bacterium]|nr:hypothetical protein [Deltaproteobacteria bacterium]
MEKTKRFIMSREGIGFFKAILESYEEVALLTVLDGKRGDIQVIFPVCFEETVDGIIADMARFGIAFQEVADV